MRSGTIVVRWFEVLFTSSMGPIPRRTLIERDDSPSRRRAYAQATTVFALAFTCMACRNPGGAARKPTDQITLSQVAKTASQPDLKSARGEKPVDPSASDQLPMGADRNARKAAGERPADQIATSGKAQGAPVAGGESVAALTPSISPAKGPEALRATTLSPADQAALAQVARKDENWTVRKVAVERLTSQALLAEVATSDEDADLRKLAVSRLTGQAALAKVALGDKDWSVRKVAVGMLTDQVALAKIATSDGDADIRKLAVSLLTDQAALARVARGDKDWSVRRSAVDKLTDKAVLAQVATGDQDPDIRKLAVSRLAKQAATP